MDDRRTDRQERRGGGGRPVPPRLGAQSPVPTRDISGIRERLRRAMRERVHGGDLPYEGQWLPREEIERQSRIGRRKAVVRAFEILLLLVGFVLASVVLVQLLSWLAE